MATISAPTGDITPDFAIARGDEEIRQRVIQRLRFFRGEWFLDKNAGTPWFQRVLARYAPIGIVTTIITDTIAGVDGVIAVSEVESEINRETRKFDFRAKITTATGDITIQEEISA